MIPNKKKLAVSDYAKFRLGVITAIKAHLSMGGKLHAGAFFSGIDEKEVCPLSCITGWNRRVMHEEKDGTVSQFVSRKLGIQFSTENMWAFIRGFDAPGHYKHLDDSKYYQLGCKLRAKYLPLIK